MRGIYHDYQRNGVGGGGRDRTCGERPRSRRVPEEPAAGRVRTSGPAPAGGPSCAVPSLSLGLLGTTQPEGPTELAAGTALHQTLVLSGPLLSSQSAASTSAVHEPLALASAAQEGDTWGPRVWAGEHCAAWRGLSVSSPLPHPLHSHSQEHEPQPASGLPTPKETLFQQRF